MSVAHDTGVRFSYPRPNSLGDVVITATHRFCTPEVEGSIPSVSTKYLSARKNRLTCRLRGQSREHCSREVISRTSLKTTVRAPTFYRMLLA